MDSVVGHNLEHQRAQNFLLPSLKFNNLPPVFLLASSRTFSVVIKVLFSSLNWPPIGGNTWLINLFPSHTGVGPEMGLASEQNLQEPIGTVALINGILGCVLIKLTHGTEPHGRHAGSTVCQGYKNQSGILKSIWLGLFLLRQTEFL